MPQVLENFSINWVSDEFHSAQGQDHKVRSHSPNVLDHIILDPVVVLQVQPQSVLIEILT